MSEFIHISEIIKKLPLFNEAIKASKKTSKKKK